MLTTRIVRCFSTRSIVDKWFNALQSRTHEEQQTKLAQCIDNSLQQDQSNDSNFVREIIHHWAIEQPKMEALWTCEADSDECEKLTFNDIYTQSSQFTNDLTENQFNLTTGKHVGYLRFMTEMFFFSTSNGDFTMYYERTNFNTISLSSKWFNFLSI
jgi:hypothetical protein